MKKVITVLLGIVIMALAGFGAWYFTNSQQTPETISIGMQPLASATLIYIAEDQGYFAGNGLKVTIRAYEAGVAALKGMVKGEVDLSLPAEYPFVIAALQKENISIIGSTDKYLSFQLVGRKDRGIKNVSDLKGKKIGVPQGTIGEFYLGRFLNLHGINLREVFLVNTSQADSQNAVIKGSVDAVMIMQNNIRKPIIERLPNEMVIWPAQNNQTIFSTLACKNDWIVKHPGTINRFLKSLNQAELFIIKNPDVAKAIIKKRLNYTDSYITAIWPGHQFSLSLDQSLLIAMVDEGRWAINNNFTSAKTLPDFSKYLYTKGIEKVKPEAVNIR